MEHEDRAPPAELRVRAGDGWSLHEFVCSAGPSTRAFEERHDGYSIAAVLEGTFTYRSEHGRALLYPGALLLGNSGRCFACGHEHGVGDRCVSLNIGEGLFAEIAASRATSRFQFPTPILPSSSRIAGMFASLERAFRAESASRRDELVFEAVEAVVAGLADRRGGYVAATGAETRRVTDCLRFIDENAGQPIRLPDLAARAGLSKYHFLRVFRRLAGVTPYQYVLTARLRRAAGALKSSRRPVIEIALDSGFDDLSTFNRHFRRAFGMAPGRFRNS